MNRSRATLAGWTTLLALGLLAAGGAEAGPGGILLGVPSVTRVVLVVFAGALLAWAARGSTAIGACAGMAFVPLLLLSGIPIAGLRALTGPPLFALVLAGTAIVLAERRPAWARRLFFPVVLALYLVVAARVQAQVGAEGDEPHYLMVAESLMRDHDLALEPDYAEGRYRPFYRTHETLAPHFRVRGRNGEIYSLHAVGLSLLVLPAYALGGYPAASFFMAFLAALLAREVREVVRSSFDDDGLGDGVGWLVALSPPLVHYAGLIFTEVPAALALALALRRGKDVASLAVGAAVALGVALAFLPWLNVRYAPIAALLVLYLLSARPRRWTAVALVAPGVASAVAFAAYHFILYGFFDPRRVYGVRPELSLGLLPEGAQGLLLDQEFGLLVYAPVFVLAFAGLITLFRERWRTAATGAVLLLLVFFMAGSWPMWRGGFNPPSRFLLPLLPVLALGVAARLRGGFGGAAALLVGWSLFAGLAGGLEPRLVHRDRDGVAPLFRERSGAEEWTRLLPGYVLADEEPDRHRLAIVWAAALALAAVRWRRPTFPAAGLGVAAAGLVVAAGIAGALSDGRTGGRDAVRLVGAPALSVPGWRLTRAAPGEWGPSDLSWGPLYEPHRHPEGAEVGSRLAPPLGSYVLRIEGEAPPYDGPLAELEVRPQGSVPRRYSFARAPAGLVASFEVRNHEREITLALRGGGPLLVRSIHLERSTLPGPGGLNR